ncbi:multidrug effflux MFS transporter [Mesorhizobium sp. J18]|uniref:multidrug effflux MFS transporter n=1 Tax=Mesorhizobium sp. J18 TaxID=935263 RepID=UPI001645C36D|nr:multidrug effflux MFS transporter [Mesorhizobium sp. J18]
MGRAEFIALAAGLMALNALAIDIMLPGLQQMGAALGVENENHRQYIITAYVVGFGLAQLPFGPISDRFGRRAPLLVGIAVYLAASLLAALTTSFPILLLLRFLQGAGAAATRVVAVSVVRDVYGGRQMAEVMSLVMMVFMIVPVIAPSIGQVAMMISGWHMIFIFMGAVAFLISIWAAIRLPETLKPEFRRPFTLVSVAEAFSTVMSNRISLCYAFGTAFIFGALFGFINSAQQIYVDIYDLGAWFPIVFAGVAGLMAVSSFLNSRLVGRIGMRRLSHGALLGFLAVNAAWFATSLVMDSMPFPLLLLFFMLAMFQFGWIGANFNALAMEPLGHVAGTASSVLGFMQTFGGGVIGTIIGQSFDGTVTPLAAGFCIVSVLGLVMVLIAERGKLFAVHNPPV